MKDNLLGKTFGDWLVIAAAPSKSYGACWKVKCQCGLCDGIEKILNAGTLKREQSTSCGTKHKLTSAIVSERYNSRHGDKDDISDILSRKSITSDTVVWPICKVSNHGPYPIKVNALIDRGSRCGKCRGTAISEAKLSSTDIDAKKAEWNKIHNGKWDYSLIAEWMGTSHKYPFLCSTHGIFPQLGLNHSKGSGCPGCARERQGATRSNTDEFVVKAQEKHGQKYGYDRTQYVRSNKPVEIFCFKCEEYFWQPPNKHLNGGHLACSGRAPKDRNEFILQAKEEHGDDEFEYYWDLFNGMNRPMPMRHKKCGYLFNQAPSSHLQGRGCPVCNLPGLNEKMIAEELLKRGIEFVAQFKIRKWGSSLPAYKIDFLLPSKELAIEYNGLQHYEAVLNQFGNGMTQSQAEKQFIWQQNRDQLIRDVCEKHNIELITIDGRDYAGGKLRKHICNVLIPQILARTATQQPR